MKMKQRILCLLLALCLFLTGCMVSAAETPETAAGTEATAAPTAMPTEPEPTEPAATEPAVNDQVKVTEVVRNLTETKLPEKDKATGTMKFYINDKVIYPGGPVADVLDAGISTYDDLDQMVAPWQMSPVIRFRVEDEEVKLKDRAYVFFVAVNPSDTEKAIRDCLFYSITVNYANGVPFGSGNEKEPFVTGVSTMEEVTAAYGKPTHSVSGSVDFAEIAYYEPFSCVYMTFKKNVVKQITAYYSANIYGAQAEAFDHALYGGYFGADCYILMDQYLDVEPYLPLSPAALKAAEEAEAKAAEEAAKKAEEAAANPTEPPVTEAPTEPPATDPSEPTVPVADRPEEEILEEAPGVVKPLPVTITMDGKEIKMGVKATEMPDPFGKPFDELLMPVSRNYYVRTGIVNEEEFYLLNLEGQTANTANELTVKGVITENRNYTNWGVDNSEFHEFSYDGLTQDATIDHILEKYGQPLEIHCSSNGRVCFAWLHYMDTTGKTLRFKVDPMLNQLVEIRVTKYFENAQMYY